MDRREFAGLVALGLPMIGGCASRSSRVGTAPDFVTIIARVTPSVVSIGDGKQALGSGFAVARDLVVTASHVAQTAGALITVTSSAGRETARLVAMREEDDLAVLEVRQPLPPLALITDPARVGEWIVVVGNPFGGGTTATAGIVSAAPGAISTPELSRRLQISAAVNPGNSGGPVCNLRGEVVGATTSLVAGGQGIAFATPASALRSFLTSIRK